MAQPHVQHMGTTWDILESFGTTLQQYQDNCETILWLLWDNILTSYGIVAERTASFGQLMVIAFSVYPISLNKNEPQICSQKDERPEGLHVCVDDDEDEGDEEVEEQPDIDHLQVGGVW